MSYAVALSLEWKDEDDVAIIDDSRVLFSATALLDTVHVFRTRDTHDPKPAREVHVTEGV